MIFQITQSDIDNGVADDCFNCPAGLCITRTTGKRADVSLVAIDIEQQPGVWESFDMPLALALWIDDFDAGEPVEPISFELPYVPFDEVLA